jgi:hypothetical protein
MSIKLSIYEGAAIEKLSTQYVETLLYFLTDMNSMINEKGEEDNYVNRLSIKNGNGMLPEKMAEILGTRLHLNMRLYRTPVKTSLLSCVKAPGLSDRKMGRIALILPILRSLNRGNFHAAQK